MECWVDLGSWLHTEMVYLLQAVTHPGTNLARRRLTLLIGWNTLLLCPATNLNHALNFLLAPTNWKMFPASLFLVMLLSQHLTITVFLILVNLGILCVFNFPGCPSWKIRYSRRVVNWRRWRRNWSLSSRTNRTWIIVLTPSTDRRTVLNSFWDSLIGTELWVRFYCFCSQYLAH